jgi:hypothetical protein
MQSGRFAFSRVGRAYLPFWARRRLPRRQSALRSPLARLVMAVEMTGLGGWIFWECKNRVISRMAYLEFRNMLFFVNIVLKRELARRESSVRQAK